MSVPRSLALIPLVLALPVAFAGCSTMSEPPREVQPDLKAIASVISEAYRSEGQARAVLFLDSSGACASISPACQATNGGIDSELKASLEANLRIKVRPESDADRSDPTVPALTPILPETGEVGVSVSVGRFSAAEAGRLRVNVSIARSGLDGVVVEYVLQPEGDGWSIVGSEIVAVS